MIAKYDSFDSLSRGFNRLKRQANKLLVLSYAQDIENDVLAGKRVDIPNLLKQHGIIASLMASRSDISRLVSVLNHDMRNIGLPRERIVKAAHDIASKVDAQLVVANASLAKCAEPLLPASYVRLRRSVINRTTLFLENRYKTVESSTVIAPNSDRLQFVTDIKFSDLTNDDGYTYATYYVVLTYTDSDKPKVCLNTFQNIKPVDHPDAGVVVTSIPAAIKATKQLLATDYFDVGKS